MTPSQKCIDIIKEFEGCRLEAYQNKNDKPTIGYGHTKGVVLGTKITQEEADAFLVADLKEVAMLVRNALQVPVNQNQFDALCSFTFNVGIGRLRTSTLLKKINAGNIKDVGNEWGRWIYLEGEVQPGLVRRRKAERALFEAQA